MFLRCYKKVLTIVSILLVLIFGALTPAAAATSQNVQGKVVDSEGASIAKAQVLIRTDASGRNAAGQEEIFINTNSDGQFTVYLKPGFYDVCVMADGFTPRCEKLFMKPGATLTLRFSLSVDPIITKHLGDVF